MQYISGIVVNMRESVGTETVLSDIRIARIQIAHLTTPKVGLLTAIAVFLARSLVFH